MELATYFDHTCLKPNITKDHVEKLCGEAIEYGFCTVCIPLAYVELSKNLLKDSAVKVCTVVGFPFGNTPTELKLQEVQWALAKGADELDMVINISQLKEKKLRDVELDIRALVEAVHGGTNSNVDSHQNKNDKSEGAVSANVIKKISIHSWCCCFVIFTMPTTSPT